MPIQLKIQNAHPNKDPNEYPNKYFNKASDPNPNQPPINYSNKAPKTHPNERCIKYPIWFELYLKLITILFFRRNDNWICNAINQCVQAIFSQLESKLIFLCVFFTKKLVFGVPWLDIAEFCMAYPIFIPINKVKKYTLTNDIAAKSKQRYSKFLQSFDA